MLAGLGLAFQLPAVGATAALDVQVAEGAGGADPVTVEETVNRAMHQAEIAIGRAAEVGKSVAIRLSSGGVPRSLVLPSADMKEGEADRLSEDLEVMSRILEKAANSGPEARLWIGGVFGAGGGRNPDAFYLEGFGALFLLRVDFPLLAPPAAKPAAEPDEADRVWEATRRELKGDEGRGGDRVGRTDRAGIPRGVGGIRRGTGRRVEDGFGSGLETRPEPDRPEGRGDGGGFGAGTFGGRGRTEGEGRWTAGARGRHRSLGQGPDTVRGTGSMLTLRAKKGDIDAFAKGDLTVEDFGKKVRETLPLVQPGFGECPVGARVRPRRVRGWTGWAPGLVGGAVRP